MRVRAAALLLPVCLALAAPGCAAVRRAREAQDPRSAVPGERTPTAAELGLATTGPLRLEDAVDVALRVHPSVVLARHQEEAAASRLGQAAGGVLPELSASASADYRDQGPKGRGPGPEHHFQSLGFQVSWLLFDFGKTPALVRQAARQWLAAQEDRRAAEVAAAADVRIAFFSLEKQVRLAEVARDAVRQFQEHLDQVRELVRVGKRIPYDETKADLDLGNARLALELAENGVRTGQANLAASMGLAEVTDWTAEDAPAPPELPAFDACWEAAARSQPELAAARAREEAASSLVDARVAALYPSLSLGLGFTSAGSVDPWPWSLRAGPSAGWIPFDGFTNLYSVEEATANLRASRALRTQAEQRAWLDVRTAWLAAGDARQRMGLTDLTVRSAEQNVQLAQGRFDVGAGTAVELTDARQALNQARADRVQARADLDIAMARLARAQGRTGREPPEAPADGRRP